MTILAPEYATSNNQPSPARAASYQVPVKPGSRPMSSRPLSVSWKSLAYSASSSSDAVRWQRWHESNTAFRDRKIIQLARDIFLGNHALLEYLVNECEDVVTGNSLEELVDEMNRLNSSSQTVGKGTVEIENVKQSIQGYDAQIDLGKEFHNDEQLRRIAQVRHWRGDRSRTCKFAKILDKKSMPLVAFREFIISRKSMGGIQTDLQSRVLSNSGEPIPGLYAAGEAAGFGGGGINGLKSLEGTFISNCILNARMAVRSICNKPLTP